MTFPTTPKELARQFGGTEKEWTVKSSQDGKFSISRSTPARERKKSKAPLSKAAGMFATKVTAAFFAIAVAAMLAGCTKEQPTQTVQAQYEAEVARVEHRNCNMYLRGSSEDFESWTVNCNEGQ